MRDEVFAIMPPAFAGAVQISVRATGWVLWAFEGNAGFPPVPLPPAPGKFRAVAMACAPGIHNTSACAVTVGWAPIARCVSARRDRPGSAPPPRSIQRTNCRNVPTLVCATEAKGSACAALGGTGLRANIKVALGPQHVLVMGNV